MNSLFKVMPKLFNWINPDFQNDLGVFWIIVLLYNPSALELHGTN